MNQMKQQAMQGLKDKLRDVAKHIPQDKPLVYLDYPVHLNFGDILIMRGTERFFEDHGYKVAARASVTNVTRRLLDSITPETTIVFHGGGNFGDLYPIHQNHREDVVRRFPRNKIVILPQTVHFTSPEKAQASAAVFRSHPDLTMLVRDEPSFAATAGVFSDKVFLSPDMAHQLWCPDEQAIAKAATVRPLQGMPSIRPTLYFMRKDIEATDSQTAVTQRARNTYDWMDFIPVWKRRVYGLILRAHQLETAVGTSLGAGRLWYRYCDHLADRMTAEFDRFGDVITSRLHGLIFSTLLGKRVRYVDNSYGKLGNYARVWLKDAPDVMAYDKAA